jgi:hypothetical protein
VSPFQVLENRLGKVDHVFKPHHPNLSARLGYSIGPHGRSSLTVLDEFQAILSCISLRASLPLLSLCAFVLVPAFTNAALAFKGLCDWHAQSVHTWFVHAGSVNTWSVHTWSVHTWSVNTWLVSRRPQARHLLLGE